MERPTLITHVWWVPPFLYCYVMLFPLLLEVVDHITMEQCTLHLILLSSQSLNLMLGHHRITSHVLLFVDAADGHW